MRIVVLISVFQRGGAERQAYLLARELRRQYDLDVAVWALLYDGEYRQEFRDAGIPTRVIGFRRPRHAWEWPRQIHRIVRALRSEQVDVVLPYTTWPNVAVGMAIPFARTKVAIWGERHSGGERVPFWEHLAARQYKRFMANSTSGVEFLKSVMKIPQGSITYLPNGVEACASSAQAVSQNWRKRLGVPDRAFVVLKIANLTEFKDHLTLLKAWKVVLQRWSSSERLALVLAGFHGDTFASLRDFVECEQLGSTVLMPGAISPIHELIDECDLGAFSSPGEGQPNGVLELMAGGRPVVASAIPGVVDALGDDPLQLVPPGNAAAFADSILRLLTDPELRKCVGEANRVRVQTQFSVEGLGRRIFDIVSDEWKAATGEAVVSSGVKLTSRLSEETE